VAPSGKVRVVGCLVAFFGVACVAFGLNLLLDDYDLGSEEKLLFGWGPLALGVVALYSGLSVFRSGRI
jgi:hypothetical protein